MPSDSSPRDSRSESNTTSTRPRPASPSASDGPAPSERVERLRALRPQRNAKIQQISDKFKKLVDSGSGARKSSVAELWRDSSKYADDDDNE